MMAIPLRRGFDLGPRKHLLRSFAVPTMRLADDVLQSVLFLGHSDPEGKFTSCGTGFLIRHESSGAEYLVTAQHVAKELGDHPFSIRINRKAGAAIALLHDPELENEDGRFSWVAHSDPTVDIAVMPFNVDLKAVGCDHLFLDTAMALDEQWKLRENVGCGQLCYAVGLFAVHQGQQRNVAVVHTGHIALMPNPDELVPLKEKRGGAVATVEREAYLVELSNLGGLSGAPVFIRPDMEIPKIACRDGMMRDALVPQASLFLLGVWQGSWDTPGPDGRIPVGMGAVTPAEKLIEILESEAAVAARERWLRLARWKNAASPD